MFTHRFDRKEAIDASGYSLRTISEGDTFNGSFVKAPLGWFLFGLAVYTVNHTY